METTQLNSLQYPIGPYVKSDHYSFDTLASLIKTLEEAPSLYSEVARTIHSGDLKKTYREGSWNIQQLFHHVADIQFLHFLRMKKALTETNNENLTMINMDGWALTVDGFDAPIADSLMIFEGVTKRYVLLARSLDETSLKIEYYHPLRKYHINQAQALSMSAWHIQHHLAHIKVALGVFNYSQIP